MSHFSFVVMSNPVQGHEDEYNHWYDTVHLHDVLAVEGVVSAQRFRFADIDDDAPPYRYLAVYEWDTDSVESARAALTRARDAGLLPVSETLERSSLGAWFFEPIAPALVRTTGVEGVRG